MKRIVSCVVASAAVFAAACFGSANAADLGKMVFKAPPPPPPAPVFNWTGCHIGADVGGGWVTDKDSETVSATGAASAFSPYPSNTARPSGVTAGGYLGCDYQFNGGMVVGVEGDADWANIRGHGADFVGTGTPPEYYQTRINLEDSARGRIGYAFDRSLFYVTGGAAWAHISEQDNSPATGVSSVDSTTRLGWTAGGGIEYAFLDCLIGRVEYRYSDFGTFSYSAPVFAGFTENHRLTENAVRLGLSYKFDVSSLAKF
jgi:outer membrane immunogenic protein